MERFTFTREELYELVWKESLLSLSKKYEISDVGLRKACIRMSIPTPPAGYWMKLQSGKKPAKIKLPGKYEGNSTIELEIRKPKEKSEKTGPSNADILQEINTKYQLDFKVATELKNPDKLVVAARQKLREKEQYYSQYKGVKTSDRDTLDIRVSPQNISRTLCFMDALIKLLKKMGNEVIIGEHQYEKGTFAKVNGQMIRIYMRDRLKKVIVNRDRWNSTEMHSSGLLFFNVGGSYGKEYMDGKQTIEEQMPDVIVRLIQLSNFAIQAKKESDERHAEWERKEKIRKEIEQRKQIELSDFITLMTKYSRWQQSRQIREYLNELEKHAVQNNQYSEDFKMWLERAREKADWFDPMIERNDPWLEGVDRDNLLRNIQSIPRF